MKQEAHIQLYSKLFVEWQMRVHDYTEGTWKGKW